ncbi:MAG: Rrf2 family transcriptional regulator [Flavobacteriales bacterium]|nr:Rrf2 family transcriptional regulator [Flavobacteriales bacterium]
MFSKACEYGMRAMVHIATHGAGDQFVGVREVAEAVDAPEAFTAKILQKLSRSGLLNSVKGPGGGFSISQEAIRKVHLIDIVEVIDGKQAFEGCVLGLPNCGDENPCPLHDQYVTVRTGLRSMLSKTSLKDMVSGIRSGETHLRVPLKYALSPGTGTVTLHHTTKAPLGRLC